jgi:hypothetical protein
MKYYSVDIQVDFEVPRGMPPQLPSDKPWRAVGLSDIFSISTVPNDQRRKLSSSFLTLSEDMKIPRTGAGSNVTVLRRCEALQDASKLRSVLWLN